LNETQIFSNSSVVVSLTTFQILANSRTFQVDCSRESVASFTLGGMLQQP